MTCGRCKKQKPDSEFPPGRRTCHPCAERYRLWYERNRDDLLLYQKRHRQENAEAKATADRRYREANAARIAQRKREYYLANREVHLAKSRAYREANAEMWRENARRYHRNNQAAVAEYNRQRREVNRDAISAYLKEWNAANRDKRNIANARRNAAKIARTVEVFSAAQLAAHYAAMGYSGCVYCSGPHEHDDHIVPLSRGGAHSLDNLAPACARCNVSKGAKMLAEWFGFADRKVHS